MNKIGILIFVCLMTLPSAHGELNDGRCEVYCAMLAFHIHGPRWKRYYSTRTLQHCQKISRKYDGTNTLFIITSNSLVGYVVYVMLMSYQPAALSFHAYYML